MNDIIITKASARNDYDPDSRRMGRIQVYCWPDGESVFENLVGGRHNRPYEMWKPVVTEFLTTFLGFAKDSFQLSWSKNAGCSMCPCSPGFIVKGFTGTVPVSYGMDVDIHLNIARTDDDELMREAIRAAFSDSPDEGQGGLVGDLICLHENVELIDEDGGVRCLDCNLIAHI